MPNTINRVTLPNLVFNTQNPGFKKIIEITNPAQELAALKKLDALDGKVNGIAYSDFETNQEKFLELMQRLRGLHLYANDNGEGLTSTMYDLATALSMLQTLEKKLGKTSFSKSMVVFEEKLLGHDATKLGHNHEGRHHVIDRAFTVPLSEQPYAVPENQLAAKKLNSSSSIDNLQTYATSQVKFQTIIKNPQRELALLVQISQLDGDSESISTKDTTSEKFLALFNKLEGKGLYGNDMGTDGKVWNLDAALSILKSIKSERGALSEIQVYFNQAGDPSNSRWAIESGQVLLNQASGHYIVVKDNLIEEE
jgi:hypothetical protein